MLINKRKNPLVTHLIVGLKNEHGLYKIHTEVSPTQLVGTELLRNIMPIFDPALGMNQIPSWYTRNLKIG